MKHQVIILAGGESSRFFPFDKLHKSFFKLAGKTILERTVESIKKTDPKDIIVVLGSKNFEEEKAICSQINAFEGIKYVSQGKALGQADAILSAEEHIDGNFFVVNAQQFDFDDLASDFLNKFDEGDYTAVLGSAETETPNKYGILSFNGDKVSGVVEKPKIGTEPSNRRLVGIYLFSPEFLKELRRTEISEYSLETALNKIAKEDKIAAVNINNKPPSLKYPWDILTVKDLILSNLKSEIHKEVKIEKTAIIRGDNVFIDKGAHVCDFSIIEGPAYVGENAVVGAYCQVRGGSVLEKGSQVERYTDLKNSYIGENTHIHSGFVGDSVIGANVRIGAEFVSANKRLDRGSVHAIVKAEKVDTGRTNLGVIIGDNVKVGIRVSTMPGAIVAANSSVYPDVTVK